MKTLTLDQVRNAAPSVFASNPFPGMSGRYAFVPTASIVEQMMAEGWAVREASQSRVRLSEKVGFQKHMIRFARVSDIEKVNAGIDNRVALSAIPEFPEVVLVNAHDGSSTYQLSAGIYRLVCCNGMVVADSMFASLRVRHTGSANAILGASYQVLESAHEIMGSVSAMKAVTLTAMERSQFALGGAMLRYGFSNLEDCPINYNRLLDARRHEDEAPTLWNTLNTVQENLMKGKQSIRLGEDRALANGRMVRPKRTMSIKAVDATLKVNKGVWEMAGTLLAQKS